MRRAERAVTDGAAIREILREGKILHLGLMDGDYPYVVPLHYGFLPTATGFVFYMHGAKCGHKIDLIQAQSNAFVEIEADVRLDPGGEDPCRYGAFYSSFMGRGKAEILEDAREKKLPCGC